MKTKYAIVDLFAGPGGLGEGFSAAGREGGGDMRIALSVEMDRHAVATLRLRSFLRQFEAGFPKAYYSALNNGAEMPDWSAIRPCEWAKAQMEVLQIQLGASGAFKRIAPTLDSLRNEYSGNTILIGGPPCQAYSLVGRARNRGIAGYLPERDSRHFLYREYVRILGRLRPVAFVMENVKGMLSCQMKGGTIFERVLEDLAGAADGYRLVPLAVPVSDNQGLPPARDFVVRAEDYGVPQARHRVFIVGLRQDRATSLMIKGLRRKSDFRMQSTRKDHARNTWTGAPLLDRNDRARETVMSTLSGLPPLRSGISQAYDTHSVWRAAVRDAAKCLIKRSTDKNIQQETRYLLKNGLASHQYRSGSELMPLSKDMAPDLAAWLFDSKLECSLNHETRSHIADDLGRYLFAAVHGLVYGISPKLQEFPHHLQPKHRNRDSGAFSDRFRVQLSGKPSSTITSHISKDGHYYIHPDPHQCRSLTVREAARLQTFPDNYLFCGPRTEQYKQVGNAVPPYLAREVARAVRYLLSCH